MMTKRTFIAVALPHDVQQVLGQVSTEMAELLPPRVVRWVKPENMHLTLRFLGDTAVSKLPPIAAGLDRMAGQLPPFDLSLSQIGFFPNKRRPRVVWIGLAGELEALGMLKKQVDVLLQDWGWEVEKRPFRPHLTLGRIKEPRRWRNIPLSVQVPSAVIPVTAVHHIESRLRQTGATYINLHTAKLVNLVK